jgi:putative transposase
VHVLNRGNDRRTLFKHAHDYEDFLELMRHAASHDPLRILAYVLMPNHWHMVVWPESATQLSQYMQRLGTAHAARWRQRSGSNGEGHVYQGRYHAFVVESEQRYLNVVRYVEANPLRAGLVATAAAWRWSSLTERATATAPLVVEGPVPLPPNWPQQVDLSVPADVLADFRGRLQRIHRAAWQPTRHHPVKITLSGFLL